MCTRTEIFDVILERGWDIQAHGSWHSPLHRECVTTRRRALTFCVVILKIPESLSQLLLPETQNQNQPNYTMGKQAAWFLGVKYSAWLNMALLTGEPLALSMSQCSCKQRCLGALEYLSLWLFHCFLFITKHTYLLLKVWHLPRAGVKWLNQIQNSSEKIQFPKTETVHVEYH